MTSAMRLGITALGVVALVAMGGACSTTERDASPSPAVATATSEGTAPSTGSASPAPMDSSPATAEPQSTLVAFPPGNTYWTAATGYPVVAYRDGARLCWFNWTGLDDLPIFTGTMTADTDANAWLWQGLMGAYPYAGRPGAADPLANTFAPLADGSWEVTRVDQPGPVDPSGSGDPSQMVWVTDKWTPSDATQAARTFVTFMRLGDRAGDYPAPLLTGCPSEADFTSQ